MKNEYFLEKLLQDNNDYWVVAKENYARQYMEEKRLLDDILLIAIPLKIERPAVLRDVTLGKIEDIERTVVAGNIFFTGNYSPFQIGITISNFWDGFPIPKNVHAIDFLKRALLIKSTELGDYRKILEDLMSQNGGSKS